MVSSFAPKDAVQFLNRNFLRRERLILWVIDIPAPRFHAEAMNTATASERNSMSPAGWLCVLLGAWMVISPFVLGFAHAPAGISNNVLVGLAIIVCSFAGVKQGLLRAFVILLGAWMYASAFILYVPVRSFLWNNLILAGAVILAAVATEA